MLCGMIRRVRAKHILSVAVVILLAAVIVFRNNIQTYAGAYVWTYETTHVNECTHLADLQGERKSVPLGNVSFSVLLRGASGIIKVPLKNVSFDVMLRNYEKKLHDLQTAGLWKVNDVKPCKKENQAGRACMESICREPKPATPEESLKNVLSTMSGLNTEDLRLLMGLFPEPPTGRRAMFVTAASSDHYNESQGLIRNLHQNVFPLIDNYTFVYYDLGLLAWQRQQLKKHCRCEVRSFPLEFMPSRLQNLKCYTWKPMIVQANLPKADILVWMDASVRFSNNVIKPLLDDVERRGMVIYPGGNSVAQHTLQVAMTYMKEDICSLAPVLEHQATFMVFRNELLIREAVVKPWVACAMSPNCMCPRDPHLDLHCNIYIHNYNKCHRFDQSAINIILTKLFRSHTSTFYSAYGMHPKVKLMRGQRDNYFHELERKSSTGKI
ncbi:uncharacterized protein [Haliotis cracherodii]|uniref:uncharacterized protein n=1 Tax=Haliotis cracherodii TaxID=6455 RepID=UPI0039E9351A